MLKILAFDGDGYRIWSKRLEAGRFATRGKTDSGNALLNRTALLALIEGTVIEVKRLTFDEVEQVSLFAAPGIEVPPDQEIPTQEIH